MKAYLVTVDPGTRYLAYAVVSSEGRLIEAKKFVLDAEMLGVRCAQAAQWMRHITYGGCHALLVEHPRVNQGSRADPNDIVDLATITGACCTAPVGNVMLVKPSRWKGSVPKKIHQARLLGRLPLDWIKMLGDSVKDHDIVDAVGIAWWAVQTGMVVLKDGSNNQPKRTV